MIILKESHTGVIGEMQCVKGNDNTRLARSILSPTNKHSTKKTNVSASPKIELKTLLQIPIGQVHEKILKK